MGSYTGTVPTFLAGELPDADKLAEVTDLMTAITAARTSYTPVWTSDATNPTMGNTQLTGRYRRLGNGSVDVDVSIIVGSSGFVAGTGVWKVSLPVAMRDIKLGNGVARFTDAAVQNYGAFVVVAIDTTHVHFFNPSGAGALLETTYTLSSGDTLSFSFNYEPA